MINNHPMNYPDFLTPVSDPIDIDLAMVGVTAPHLDPMLDRKQALLRLHAFMHQAGHDDTQAHTDCIEALQQVDTHIDRVWKAIWS